MTTMILRRPRPPNNGTHNCAVCPQLTSPQGTRSILLDFFCCAARPVPIGVVTTQPVTHPTQYYHPLLAEEGSPLPRHISHSVQY